MTFFPDIGITGIFPAPTHPSMKKVLVTGANGFLGSNLVRILLHRGFQVKAFLLKGVPYHTIASLPIGFFYGDLLQPRSIQRAVAGCDYVVHLAAKPSVWPTRSDEVRKVNIEGTRHVVQACLRAGIERLIHISSAASFPFGTKEHPGVEAIDRAPVVYDMDYIYSKWKSQQLVLQAVVEAKLPALVINPTYMLGPYGRPSGSNQMILRAYQGSLPAFTGGGKNFVHVTDVAVAIANALTKGRIGQCYIAGNENLSYRELFGKIARLLQAPPPRFLAPDWLMKGFGWCSSQLAQVLPIRPALNYSTARIACDGQYYSAARAVAELNMPQTPVDQAIVDAFQWFTDIGAVKLKKHEQLIRKSSADHRLQHGYRQATSAGIRQEGRAFGNQRQKS